MSKKNNAARMMALFAGFRGAHGTHGAMVANPEKNGKLEIKKSARTLREPVTEALWQRHLDGDYYLGVIPIDEDGLSSFGCIDVDRYDINLGEVAGQLRKRKLPMLVCRSKSGGAHVYMFLNKPVPAGDLRAKLRQIAANMGWGECEIFPKQTTILAERGDLGNWLNMPYQNAKAPERYGVKETLAAMDIGEFLNVAESLRTDIGSAVAGVEDPQDESLDDGPPCLQHMCAVGFPEGQKNNGFFGLATFCKKKYGTRWREVLEEYNRKFFSPPRPADEVADVMKRIEAKEYNYRCKDQPLAAYCNSALCKTRKFGVGGGGHYPSISGLSKLDTDTPLWFLDINDKRVELNTRQLSNYREFQMVCMDQLTVMFMPMKMETWASMIGAAMDNAMIIDAPLEMSARGQFMELLEAFCTDQSAGMKIEELYLGKPFLDEAKGRHYFRLQDLAKYLEREGFKAWGRTKLGQVLREIGDKEFLNVKGKGLNVFWVPANFEGIPDIDEPDIKEDPL